MIYLTITLPSLYLLEKLVEKINFGSLNMIATEEQRYQKQQQPSHETSHYLHNSKYKTFSFWVSSRWKESSHVKNFESLVGNFNKFLARDTATNYK